MKLYFSPLACSMATRIALYEASAPVEFVEVDSKTKRTAEGRDFRELHPLGLVPALELNSGKLLSENAAVLQHVARTFPGAGLAPSDAEGTAGLQQWLCFIGTELHKALFTPLLGAHTTPDVRAHALALSESRLGYASAHLRTRDHLLTRYSVADAYLFTVLSWSVATPVNLSAWPVLTAYRERLLDRPAVARAFREEQELYRREKARHGALIR